MRVTRKKLIELGFSYEYNNVFKSRNIKTFNLKIPYYDDAYLYCYEGNLKTFYFGDKRDTEFFTIRILSIEQLKDLMKSLDYSNYKK